MAGDFEMMEKSARKMAAQVKAAEGRAAKAAAKKAAADRLATIAYQRGMSGPSATAMVGRVATAAGLAITAAEIARALREKGKTGKERIARGTRIAKEAEKMAVKPKSGQSPTDAMRANMTGRVTTGTSRKPNAVKVTPTAPIQSPTQRPKQESKQTFGQAFAAARKAGKKEFMYNGKPYHTRTKEEEAARAKPASTKTNTASENKTEYKGPRAKTVNKLLNEQTTNKSYGGQMTEREAYQLGKELRKVVKGQEALKDKKTVKRRAGGSVGSKPKGVGCAQRGYGKAMK